MARTAIVTGASGGIGASIAERLAGDGFQVALTYSGNASAAHATVKQIQNGGGTATAYALDVTNAEAVRQLFASVSERSGAIDCVVHCAGIMLLSPILENDLDAFDRTIAINLRGTFLVLSQAAQQVRDGGRIIALSTSVIAKATPGYGAYIASKSGVEGLVRVLANELRGRDIAVNAVAPGPRSPNP